MVAEPTSELAILPAEDDTLLEDIEQYNPPQHGALAVGAEAATLFQSRPPAKAVLAFARHLRSKWLIP